MSNKKRINRKVKILEKKRLHAYNFKIERISILSGKLLEAHKRIDLSIRDFLHWATNIFPAQIFENFEDKTTLYDVKPYQEHVQGYSFEENFDSEFTDFVFEMRKLTPLDEMACGNLCRKVPAEFRSDFKKLIIVGFDAYEALDLLKETYKF